MGKELTLKNFIFAAGYPGILFLFYNILIFFVKRRRGFEELASIDTSATFQIFYVFLIFSFSSFYIFSKKSEYLMFLISRPNIFLLLYIIVCLISSLWSVDFNLTLYRSFECLSFFMLISCIAVKISSEYSYKGIIDWLILWAIWSIFWGLATNFKNYGLDFSFYTISRLEYPVVFFLALFYSKKRVFSILIVLLAIFSLSNKIYLGISLGFLGLVFGNQINKLLIFLISLILIFLFIFIDIDLFIQNTIFYGREGIGVEFSSGRDKIWQYANDLYLQSPLIGYGFDSGERYLLAEKYLGVINSHNFIYSSLLGSGVFGLMFCLVYFLSNFMTTINKFIPDDIKGPMVSTFIVCLILSLTSPSVGGRVYGSWIPVVLTLTLLSAIFYKAKTKRH